jgi:hypothetical protein
LQPGGPGREVRAVNENLFILGGAFTSESIDDGYLDEFLAAGGREVRFYLTGMEWPINSPRIAGNETTRATYLARTVGLTVTIPEVAGLWVYQWSDERIRVGWHWTGFGLLSHERKPTRSFSVVAALLGAMQGSEVTDFGISRSGVTYVRFGHDGKTFGLAWGSDDRRLVHSLAAPPEATVQSVTRVGEPEAGGGIVLADGVPVLVE